MEVNFFEGGVLILVVMDDPLREQLVEMKPKGFFRLNPYCNG